MLNIVATKRQVMSTDIICSLVLWEPMMAWQIRRSCTICADRDILTGRLLQSVSKQTDALRILCIYWVSMVKRTLLSPWASLQTPTAPCRWSILGRVRCETGSGWKRPSLWGRRVPPWSPSWIPGLGAGLCGRTDLPPWSAEIHRSASTAVECAGPDWSTWSGTGMTRGLKDVEGAKRG